MSASGLEAVSGKGPGLGGTVLRQHVVAIGYIAVIARGADLPDRAPTG